MKKRDFIMSVIQEKGYAPIVDSDGNIAFMYQLKKILVTDCNDDSNFVSIILSHIDLRPHHIGEMDEDGWYFLMLAACDKATRETKMAKVWMDDDYKFISASCDFYYANKEALELCFDKSLAILGLIRTIFNDTIDELLE